MAVGGSAICFVDNVATVAVTLMVTPVVIVDK